MNGGTVAIYTTEEGGIFHVIYCSEEEYARWKAEGKITFQGFLDGGPEAIEPLVLLVLARIEDNHDFILGGPRGPA